MTFFEIENIYQQGNLHKYQLLYNYDNNPLYETIINNLKPLYKIEKDSYLFLYNKEELSFEGLTKYVVSHNDLTTLEENIIQKAKELNVKIMTAESCTGGMIVSRLIGVKGASHVIDASLVTYAESAKSSFLDINDEDIKKYTVVSREIAKEMNKGLTKYASNAYLISVTGYTVSEPKNELDGLFYFTIGLVKRNRYQEIITLNYMVKNDDRNQVRLIQSAIILSHLYNILEAK